MLRNADEGSYYLTVVRCVANANPYLHFHLCVHFGPLFLYYVMFYIRIIKENQVKF